MSIAYHGQWCGPGWSDGSYQSSVRGYSVPIDSFDYSCKDHDGAYADGHGLKSADDVFFERNFGRSLKRSLAAVAVKKYNHAPRPPSRINNKPPLPMSAKLRRAANAPRNLPTPMVAQPAKTKAPPRPTRAARPTSGISQVAAPVSIGTSIRSTRVQQQKIAGGLRVVGQEFMANVYESNNTNWQMSALVPIHPAYFNGGTLGNVARTFAEYRFTRLNVRFVTRQPTSVTGEIALVHSRNLNSPAENGASASFLPRVMTRGNAIIGPLWQSHGITIECDTKWRLVDCFTSSDTNDHVLGEVQAYTLSSVSDTAGYLIMDYICEFRETMYQPHSTLIPIVSGPGATYTCVDSSTTPTANNAVQLTNTALTAYNNGTIFRMVLDLDQSTLSTGTTAANAWNSAVSVNASTTTTTITTSNLTLIDGMQVYLVVVGSSLYAYASYEAACNGEGSGQFFYRTTGSTAASLLFIGYSIRFGPGSMAITT